MANPLMNMIGAATNNSMGNMMNMLGMFKNANNPNKMIESLINTNPQAKQAWQQMQGMIKGKDKNQINSMVNDLAKQKGLDIEAIRKQLGI